MISLGQDWFWCWRCGFRQQTMIPLWIKRKWIWITRELSPLSLMSLYCEKGPFWVNITKINWGDWMCATVGIKTSHLKKEGPPSAEHMGELRPKHKNRQQWHTCFCTGYRSSNASFVAFVFVAYLQAICSLFLFYFPLFLMYVNYILRLKRWFSPLFSTWLSSLQGRESFITFLAHLTCVFIFSANIFLISDSMAFLSWRMCSQKCFLLWLIRLIGGDVSAIE